LLSSGGGGGRLGDWGFSDGGLGLDLLLGSNGNWLGGLLGLLGGSGNWLGFSGLDLLLVNGRPLSGNIGRSLGSLLLAPLSEELAVGLNVSSGLLPLALLVFLVNPLSSESGLSDESLDLGGLLSLLSSSSGPGSSDGSSLDQDSLLRLGLLNSEQLSNLGGSLGSQSSWLLIVGQSLDFLLSLSDEGEGQDSDVVINDASSNALPLSLTRSSDSIAGVALAHQNLGASLGDNSLLHGESLLVVSSSDSKNIALVLLSQSIDLDFLSDSLVEEDGTFLVVINLEGLLSSLLGVADVELHAVCESFVILA